MNNKLSSTSLNIPKELFLVTGGYTQSESLNWIPLEDSFFAKRIPESRKHYIAPVPTWQANSTYTRYISDSNYNVVYNDDNLIVYLCLHTNTDFRNDLQSGLSTQKPSHSVGRQTYSDGYTWLPLFKVDFTEWEFVGPGEIPVPKLDTTEDYNTFAEKYTSLCGSGVTAFGCCCLYFKENSVDQITGEVYTRGDVSNETIFSDCYECQKLADNLDRDVLFLAGYTAGSIKSSQTGENPLCPATKSIKTLQETLEAQVYTTTPGSSKDYQLLLLQNHTNLGIMNVDIDLSGLTDTQKTISKENPLLTVADPNGSGAIIQLKTTPIGLSSHLVYGIQLVSSGSGYGNLPVIPVSSAVNTIIQNRINLTVYDPEIYTNPQLYAKPTKLKASIVVTEEEIRKVIPGIVQHIKTTVMADPYYLNTSAPAEYTKNDSTVQRLPTVVTLYQPSTIVNEQ